MKQLAYINDEPATDSVNHRQIIARTQRGHCIIRTLYREGDEDARDEAVRDVTQFLRGLNYHPRNVQGD